MGEVCTFLKIKIACKYNNYRFESILIGLNVCFNDKKTQKPIKTIIGSVVVKR